MFTRHVSVKLCSAACCRYSCIGLPTFANPDGHRKECSLEVFWLSPGHSAVLLCTVIPRRVHEDAMADQHIQLGFVIPSLQLLSSHCMPVSQGRMRIRSVIALLQSSRISNQYVMGLHVFIRCTAYKLLDWTTLFGSLLMIWFWVLLLDPLFVRIMQQSHQSLINPWMSVFQSIILLQSTHNLHSMFLLNLWLSV